MRLLILHTRLSGYFCACLRRLLEETKVDLKWVATQPQANSPFSESLIEGLPEPLDRKSLDNAGLVKLAEGFDPDVILVAGWADPGYVKLCRKLKAGGVLIIAGCDTQWTGSLRQQVASRIAPWHVQRFIDVLWVTGERQRQLAAKLGYTGNRCWDGYYACDWGRFAAEDPPSPRLWRTGVREQGNTLSAFPSASESDPKQPKTSSYFLFVGRYVEEKGLDTLVEAYARYRAEVGTQECFEDRAALSPNSHMSGRSPTRGTTWAGIAQRSPQTDLPSSRSSAAPWELHCCGKGPMGDLLRDREGIIDRGFVQPEELPGVMREASAFVLPSRFEPWGVVVQEAGASGLPLIVSDACGAGVHLARDRWNGRTFEADNVEALTECLLWMHQQSDANCTALGQNSFMLSRQYTPERWCNTLREGLQNLKALQSS